MEFKRQLQTKKCRRLNNKHAIYFRKRIDRFGHSAKFVGYLFFFNLQKKTIIFCLSVLELILKKSFL